METLEKRLERFAAHEIDTGDIADIVVDFPIWRTKVASGMVEADFSINSGEGRVMSDKSGLLKKLDIGKKLDVLFFDLSAGKVYELDAPNKKLLINARYLEELEQDGYLKTEYEGKEMVLMSNTYRSRY